MNSAGRLILSGIIAVSALLGAVIVLVSLNPDKVSEHAVTIALVAWVALTALYGFAGGDE